LADRLLREQIDRVREIGQAISDQVADTSRLDLPEEEREFIALVYQLRMSQTRAAIEWLERALD
jgi:hypothetical protein